MIGLGHKCPSEKPLVSHTFMWHILPLQILLYKELTFTFVASFTLLNMLEDGETKV
jgi:hypothetical protein